MAATTQQQGKVHFIISSVLFHNATDSKCSTADFRHVFYHLPNLSKKHKGNNQNFQFQRQWQCLFFLSLDSGIPLGFEISTTMYFSEL